MPSLTTARPIGWSTSTKVLATIAETARLSEQDGFRTTRPACPPGRKPGRPASLSDDRRGVPTADTPLRRAVRARSLPCRRHHARGVPARLPTPSQLFGPLPVHDLALPSDQEQNHRSAASREAEAPTGAEPRGAASPRGPRHPRRAQRNGWSDLAGRSRSRPAAEDVTAS